MREDKLPKLIVALRTTGAASLLLGLGVVFLAGWFWVGVAFIYSTFLLIGFDLWNEPKLQHEKLLRIVFIGLLFLGAAAFSSAFVFVAAPLDVSGLVTDGEYPLGSVISGIPWRPEFTELIIDIVNPTDRAYEDLNIVIRPTEPVVAVEQITTVPGVSFEDKNGFISHVLDIPPYGTSKVVPLDLLATDAGYRMRCSHLPAHSALKVEMALADIKWNPSPKTNAPIEETVRQSDYVMRIKFDDFSSYWKGHKDADVYTPRPSIEWFKVEGNYTAMQRERSISEKVTVGGHINLKRKEAGQVVPPPGFPFRGMSG
jgi:hypothetical protein